MTNSCRKLCVGAGRNGVANDQAEEVGADDSQNAADDSANQPLQADLAQAKFEQDDRNSDEHSQARGGPTIQSEGLQFVAGKCCNEDE